MRFVFVYFDYFCLVIGISFIDLLNDIIDDRLKARCLKSFEEISPVSSTIVLNDPFLDLKRSDGEPNSKTLPCPSTKI